MMVRKEDDLAIQFAAERRRRENAAKAEMDARRAEMPRLMREARREPVALLQRLWRAVRGVR